MPEKKSADDARAKFLAALDKKKASGVKRDGIGPSNESKVTGASGNTTKRFQRKSGSA